MTYRWLSSALHGRWCPNVDEALSDALRSGQAFQAGRSAPVVLKPFASIETRKPRPLVQVAANCEGILLK